MTPYMPTYSYYNIRNIRNICNIRNIRSIRSICNICNIYRTLLITVYLVGVEKLRTELRYFMHFLLDKGYFMLAYRMIENHTGPSQYMVTILYLLSIFKTLKNSSTRFGLLM
jgi:hypothetical protein